MEWYPMILSCCSPKTAVHPVTSFFFCHSSILFSEVPILISGLFFKSWVVCFLIIELWKFFLFSGSALYEICVLLRFSPSWCLMFAFSLQWNTMKFEEQILNVFDEFLFADLGEGGIVLLVLSLGNLCWSIFVKISPCFYSYLGL